MTLFQIENLQKGQKNAIHGHPPGFRPERTRRSNSSRLVVQLEFASHGALDDSGMLLRGDLAKNAAVQGLFGRFRS